MEFNNVKDEVIIENCPGCKRRCCVSVYNVNNKNFIYCELGRFIPVAHNRNGRFYLRE